MSKKQQTVTKESSKLFKFLKKNKVLVTVLGIAAVIASSIIGGILF